MFCVVVLAAFSLVVFKKVQEVGNALTYVDSIGGDVWCNSRVCDGMANNDVSISKSALVWKILTGESTDIWLCDFPESDVDRVRLATTLELLSPKSIRFDFCDDESLDWTRNRFVRATVQAFLETPARNIGNKAMTQIPDTITAAQQKFLLGMATFEEMQKQDPQFWYRNNRYEVVFQYPPDGDFRAGFLQDKWKARTFRIRKVKNNKNKGGWKHSLGSNSEFGIQLWQFAYVNAMNRRRDDGI